MEDHNDRLAHLERIVSSREDQGERLAKLEQKHENLCEEVEQIGGTLDHVVNTMDSVLLPTQKMQTTHLEEVRVQSQKTHDIITHNQGAWAILHKILLVVAAVASTIAAIYKLMGK